MDHITRSRAKADQILQDGLAALVRAKARREPPKGFVGGTQPDDLDVQITFQHWRLRLLARCMAAPEQRVRAWLYAALAAMTPEERAARDGDLRRVRPEAFRAACAAVLYELVLEGA